MICHKAIAVITGMAHFFMIVHVYYARLVSVRFEHSVCHGSLLRPYINIYIKLIHAHTHTHTQTHTYIYIYIFIYIHLER